MNATTFCGTIALLGRPNAGKSTLLNAILKHKIAAVTRRPQTTRHRVVGICTHEQSQCVYIDAPGLHLGPKRPNSPPLAPLNKLMNRTAWSVAQEAHILLYLIDVNTGLHPEDSHFLTELQKNTATPPVILLSQTDRLPKKEIRARLKALQSQLEPLLPQATLRTVSAKVPEDVAGLKSYLRTLLPQAPFAYPADHWTTTSCRFLAAELIREQAFRQLGEELPYSLTVSVEAWEETPKRTLIHASIITGKASHKPIILGRQGQRIKAIGQAARLAIAAMLEQPVHLELHVRIVNDWMLSSSKIHSLHAAESTEGWTL